MNVLECNNNNSLDKKWNKNLNLLYDLYKKNGNFKIPSKEMKSLSKWFIAQKKLYQNKKIREDRALSLESLGVSLEIKKTKKIELTEEEKYFFNICPVKSKEDCQEDINWNMSFSKLFFHWIKTGNTIPPKSDKTFSNWCSTQRSRFKQGLLRKDRKQCLDYIYFDWIGLDEKWMAKFNSLVEFKNKYGHTLIPTRSKSYRELSLFVKSQRANKRHGDLCERKISLLDSIGFVWNLDNIEERLYSLKERNEIISGKEKFSFKTKYLTPKQILMVRDLTKKGFEIMDIMDKTEIKSKDAIIRIQKGYTYKLVK